MVYDLETDEISVGRGSKNSIVIRDNEVSRDHCRLTRFSGNYQIHDLRSSNGTFVNGQRVVGQWLLQAGDLIEFGDTITLEYQLTSSDDIPDDIPNISPVEEIFSSEVHFSINMLKGPNVGRIYMLNQDNLTIGRDLNNEIVIQDPEVSRQHLRLRIDQEGYQIDDLDTTNGTFINGERLEGSRCLEAGDIIRLGTMVQLQYVLRQSVSNVEENETLVQRPLQSGKYETSLHDFLGLENIPVAASAHTTGLEPGTLRDHLVIVYAREDWEMVVAPLLVRLQDTHLSAWVDQYLVLGSDNWRSAIEQALDECWLMVLVVSQESLHSDYVRMIYRHFLGENKPIVPLLIDPTQTLPSELARLRSIIYDTHNYQRSFHKLIFEIMQMRQQQ